MNINDEFRISEVSRTSKLKIFAWLISFGLAAVFISRSFPAGNGIEKSKWEEVPLGPTISMSGVYRISWSIKSSVIISLNEEVTVFFYLSKLSHSRYYP